VAEAQIGVLIDYENVGLSPILSLFDQLSDLGRLIIKRAYADWSKAGDKANQMLELGIEAKHYFRISGSGKNASDICLAIDAIELLYKSPLDTFVIVSSDTDFLPLVSVLRSAGKTVIGAGRRGVASPALIRSCDRYIYLDDGTPQVPAHSALDDPESLLTRAMYASMDDHGEVVAGKLHNTMRRMDPGFNFRALGYRTFTQFLNSSPSVNTRRPKGGTDIWVEMTSGQNHRPGRTNGPQRDEGPPRDDGSHPAEGWDYQLHEAWARVPGGLLSGSKAAADASKVLGVSKVSSSRFKNLQGLLDASDFLRSRWQRDGNSIRRLSTV
jgi:uncharacterized protein (TIGR00288 family)